MMEPNALYSEKIDFKFMNYLAAFLGLIALGMLGLLI